MSNNLAYKKEDLVARYERWRMSLGCSNAAFLFGKPELTITAIDGLFWASWLFRSELSETTEADANPIRRVPKTIVTEMRSGLEYIDHLSEWFFTLNSLACDYRYENKEQYDRDDAGAVEIYGVPEYGSPYFTFPWIDETKISLGNRTRRPSFTRKRANGLWWMLSVWELLNEDAQLHELGWICALDSAQKKAMSVGIQFVSQLANWHESKYPTAPRGR